MKNAFVTLSFLFVVLLSGCSRNTGNGTDDPTPQATIVARWKAKTLNGKVGVFGSTTTVNQNIENDDVQVNFKSDGTFVSSAEFDFSGTVDKQPLNGTYAINGDELKLSYRVPGNTQDDVQFYKISVKDKTMSWVINTDLLNKIAKEGGNSENAALIGFITEYDVTIAFEKQ
jgi:Lipocalin-like domain